MKALAMDLGGSGGKIISGLFDGNVIEMKEMHRFSNEPFEADGHLFWDIERIFTNLLFGIRKAASDGFSSLGVDSFCNDYGLLDRNGKLTSRVYMYRDHRTIDVQERIEKVISPIELFGRTGCQRARFNTLVQLAAQMDSQDKLLIENAETLLFVPDLLNYFLCGEKTTEYTIATVSQLFNRKENDWDDKILQDFHIPQNIFPRVNPPAVEIGMAGSEILAKTGSSKFSVCTVGQHDTASAVAAVPCLEDHFIYISSGTWCLMGTETDEMITSESAYQNNFANEGGVGGRNRFLKNIMGLWLIQECQRQFEKMGIRFTFEDLDLVSMNVAPFQFIIDPNDPIFFQPGDMIGKIQAKCREFKQSAPETPGEINRCIKESLALVYRRTLNQIEELTGFDFPQIHIIGGGARSVLLNQFASSSMGKPVLAGPYEAAAAGNLCAQFVARGEISDWKEARKIIRLSLPVKEYLPNRKNEWDEAYGRFLKICDR